MPRYLKTTFPCKDCAAPVRVRRLRDGPRAQCDACIWRDRDVIRVSHAETLASHNARNGNRTIQEDGPGLDVAVPWLKAISLQLEAASLALAAVRSAQGHAQRLKLLRRAMRNLKAGGSNLGAIGPFLQRVEEEVTSETGLTLLEGENVQTSGQRPILQLVKGELDG